MLKDRKPYTILIIEDNAGDLLLIEDYILEHFASPEVVHKLNYNEAASWLLLANPMPDVILLDLTLPDVSGPGLVEAVLRTAGTVPIIVLTGFSDIEFSARSIAMGISDYLLKDDLTGPMLYKSIIYSIERKRTFQQLQESEKRYSLLFNLSPQPMWLYEKATLNFVAVNKAAIDHYGFTEEEFMTMTLLEINLPDEAAPIDLQDVRKVNGGIYKDKLRHRKKNSDIIDVEVYSTPLLVRHVPCYSAIAVDVTERNQFEQRVTKAIIKTQEEERYEIGGELHDNVCQLLATSLMSMGMLKNNQSDNYDFFFNTTNNYINMAINEIRGLSHRLAPAFFDDSTFEEAIASLINMFDFSEKFEVELFYDEKLKAKKIHRDLQLNLYRILQEQLRNISKYSQASKIGLSLVLKEGELLMSINDNGIGFSPEKVRSGIGLANMKRRAELFAGSFTLEAAPGRGCTVKISINEAQLQL
jgi:PAS domain S-box-containing protein